MNNEKCLNLGILDNLKCTKVLNHCNKKSISSYDEDNCKKIWGNTDSEIEFNINIPRENIDANGNFSVNVQPEFLDGEIVSFPLTNYEVWQVKVDKGGDTYQWSEDFNDNLMPLLLSNDNQKPEYN